MPQGQGYIIIENGQPVGEIPPGQPIPPEAIQAAMQGQIQIVDPQTGQPVDPSQLAGGPGGPPGGPGQMPPGAESYKPYLLHEEATGRLVLVSRPNCNALCGRTTL